MEEECKRIEAAVEEIKPLLHERGYHPIDIEPRELLEYLTGPTTTGDKIP